MKFAKFFCLFILGMLICGSFKKVEGKETETPNFTSFELTDTLFRDDWSFVNGVSPNGKYFFIDNGQFGIADPTIPEIEIIRNDSGKMTSIFSILPDKFVSTVDLGFSNRTFSSFVVLDDNGNSNNPKLRVRLYSFDPSTASAKLLKKVFFTDYDVSSQTANGFFTLDNRYIVIGYLITKTNQDGTVNSVVRVLDIDTLKTTDKIQVHGYSNKINTVTLTKNGKQTNYLELIFSAFNGSEILPPALLQVYEISKQGALKFKDQKNLVQFPTSIGTFNPLPNANPIESTRIAVAMFPTFLPDQPSMLQDTSLSQTLIPGNNNNLVEYNFDGDKLTLVAKANINIGTCVSSNLYVDGKSIAFVSGLNDTFTAPGGDTGTMCFLTPTEGKKSFTSTGLNISVPTLTVYYSFSDNGKWVAVAGFHLMPNFGDPIPVNNIMLFKVKSE